MEPVESETAMFQTALEAVDQKNKERARDLFTRLIKLNPNKADYWVWMSSLVPTAKEKTYCLQEALRIDQKYYPARRGLAIQGVLPPDDKKVLSLKQQRRNWLSHYRPPGFWDKILLTPIWAQIAATAAIVVSIIIILSVVYMTTPGLGAPIKPQLFGTPFDTLSPNQALLVTSTMLKPKVTPTFLGPTPLESLLKATYTPTVFYINTPHPNSEAYQAAINAYHRQDPDKMITYIQQAMTREPDAADLFYYMGEAYRMNGDYSGAINAYKQALQLDPLFAPAYLAKGRATLLGFPGSWKDAKGDMLQAVEIDPNLTEAYFDIANVIMDKNMDANSAIKYLDMAYKQNVNSPLVHLYYAKAYLMLKQPEKSFEEAQEAIDLDLTLLEAYRALGEAAVTMDQPVKAIDALNFYSIYKPDDAEALSWLGLGYRQQKDNDKALETFSRAIKANSNQFTAHLYRGIIYLENDEPRLARTDLEEALDLDKNSYEANFNLGKVLLAQDEDGNAYMKFSTAEGLAEDNAQLAAVYYWRAQSLQKMEVEKPSYKDVEAKDWTALLKLPPDVVQPDWENMARQRLQILKGVAPTHAPVTRTPLLTSTQINSVSIETETSVPYILGTTVPTAIPTPTP